jgi:predicted nuclease of predicted toxin-antitoxin system
MEIIIDECIANSTGLVLKEAGFKVINVENILDSGVEDEKIFEYGANQKIPIITHDRGFGILYHFSQIKPSTIIILQVLSPHPEATNKLLSKFLSQFDLSKPQNYGKLIIISKSNIRIRTK